MQRQTLFHLMTASALVLVLLLGGGCSKKKTDLSRSEAADSSSYLSSAPAVDSQAGDITASALGTPGDTSTLERWTPQGEGQVIDELPVIYFDFDSYELKPEEARKLDEKAIPYFKANPTAHIQIEGHCDERGTEEYNMTLGEKRATAVRDYLIAAGCNPQTLHVISYGEERPVDTGQTEEAYAKNRRVQFLVYFSE
ncbi:MAG: peptidoglycan-associated lipoprotein Pal [Candidatus Sumerlaeia bacterium]